MSIASTQDTDFEADIEVPAGTDRVYSFQVSPLDLTGCTASMITSFGTFPMTLEMDVEGDFTVTTFTTTVPNASMPAPGVYTWKILVTWPTSPAIVLQYGHGGFYVKGSA